MSEGVSECVSERVSECTSECVRGCEQVRVHGLPQSSLENAFSRVSVCGVCASWTVCGV